MNLQSLELLTMSASRREKVLAAAGVKQRLKASRRCSLAIKTHLGLTWCKLRKQKRFLKDLGIRFECEQRQRQARQQSIGEHLKGELTLFILKTDVAADSVSGVVRREAPFVYIDCLSTFLVQLLNRYDKNNRLTCGMMDLYPKTTSC